MDGVVRMPSAFSMTFAVLPSITATHELVVPRSIPMTFPMILISFFLRQVGWALAAHRTKPPISNACDGEPHIGGGVGPARTGRDVGSRKGLPLEATIPVASPAPRGRHAARDQEKSRLGRTGKCRPATELRLDLLRE